MVKHWLLLVALLGLMIAGCTGGGTREEITDPLALVNQSADLIRSANTFRIDVIQEGPDYLMGTQYGSVAFRRATAQYVAPGIMQAKVRVIALGLPIEVDVFAQADDQWYRAVWTNGEWLNQPFQEGFNPATLIAEDTGIQQALDALIDLSYVGTTELENGLNVYQLEATADGPAVSALLGGLIEPRGEVDVTVYVDTETRYPARFVVTEYNSPFVATPAAGEESEPVVWIIDIYDINGAPEVDQPEVEADTTPEATIDPDASLLELLDPTAEATAEATPEATETAEGT